MEKSYSTLHYSFNGLFQYKLKVWLFTMFLILNPLVENGKCPLQHYTYMYLSNALFHYRY